MESSLDKETKTTPSSGARLKQPCSGPRVLPLQQALPSSNTNAYTALSIGAVKGGTNHTCSVCVLDVGLRQKHHLSYTVLRKALQHAACCTLPGFLDCLAFIDIKACKQPTSMQTVQDDSHKDALSTALQHEQHHMG